MRIEDGLPEVQDFDVIVHGRYKVKDKTTENDIALVKLSRKASINAGVKIACLPLFEYGASKDREVRNLGTGLFGQKGVATYWGRRLWNFAETQMRFFLGDNHL